MRLLSGGTLADRIKQGGPLPFAEAGMLEVSIVPLKPYAGFCP